MKKDFQNGFAHLGLVLLLVVFAVVAFVGYRVFNSNDAAETVSSTSNTQQIPAINNNEDLDNAAATLNGSDLDSDLNPSSLDQDVDTLL